MTTKHLSELKVLCIIKKTMWSIKSIITYLKDLIVHKIPKQKIIFVNWKLFDLFLPFVKTKMSVVIMEIWGLDGFSRNVKFAVLCKKIKK